MNPRERFYASVAGTVLVALCCFTPVLVIALSTAGAAAFTPYLDFLLYPALAILVVVTWISYKRYAVTRRRES
jgi:mercuric ion transport protein